MDEKTIAYITLLLTVTTLIVVVATHSRRLGLSKKKAINKN